MDFKEELSRNYPYATDIFAIHMRDKLTSKNGNSNNNNQTYRDTQRNYAKNLYHFLIFTA